MRCDPRSGIAHAPVKVLHEWPPNACQESASHPCWDHCISVESGPNRAAWRPYSRRPGSCWTFWNSQNECFFRIYTESSQLSRNPNKCLKTISNQETRAERAGRAAERARARSAPYGDAYQRAKRPFSLKISSLGRAQAHALHHQSSPEIDGLAKMTYSRIAFLKRDPSFTQLKQIANERWPRQAAKPPSCPHSVAPEERTRSC